VAQRTSKTMKYHGGRGLERKPGREGQQDRWKERSDPSSGPKGDIERCTGEKEKRGIIFGKRTSRREGGTNGKREGEIFYMF